MAKEKTDHELAIYESDDGWHVQMSSKSGESWGWRSGPFSTQKLAKAEARDIAEKEGVYFDAKQ